MRSADDVQFVTRLASKGLTPTQIARDTGIPRSTVRDWCAGRLPHRSTLGSCLPSHLRALEPSAYTYLLGMYLGDGCISTYPRGVAKLRVTLDAVHPMIAAECAGAIAAVVPGKRAGAIRRRDQRTVEISCYWTHWPCLFPQHGPGPQHLRPIVLAEWQRHLVAEQPKPFLRGLIHSDGTRIIATERKRGHIRRAPRYAFKNRSEDILQLFRTTCDAVGVHCTRASSTQIAVYSKDAVRLLDEFVGPKS